MCRYLQPNKASREIAVDFTPLGRLSMAKTMDESWLIGYKSTSTRLVG